MFIDFSFMSVLLFCLCSGKRSLCIIICERSEMSEVSFWCGVQTSYEAPPVQLSQRACECFSALAYVWIDACGCRSLWVFAWENVCTCNYQRVCDHKSTSSSSRGSRMGVKHHCSSSLTVPNDSGNHDSLMLNGSVSLPLIPVIQHTSSKNTSSRHIDTSTHTVK